MTRSVLLALLSCLLFACDDGGADAPDAAKGVEEGALTDYEADSKADSWRAPTEHGALQPGCRRPSQPLELRNHRRGKLTIVIRQWNTVVELSKEHRTSKNLDQQRWI